MKVMAVIFVVLAVLVGMCAIPVNAQVPPLPHAFYGSLEVNGSPAAPGYQVEAIVEGVSLGDYNPIITTELGKYGGPGDSAPKLVVQGAIEEGAPIEFYVDGVRAQCRETGTEAWEDSYPWQSGEVTELDLTATIPVAPDGGGEGVGRDTTPPRISNIALCPEGVTETTADICWVTNERSTSQVEYWITSKMLSPLDETLVTEHHVHLTGLTPGTTYHYKTMSRDSADNEAVSDVYTFTTLEKPPAAPPTPPAPPPTAPPPEVKPLLNWTVIGGIIAGVVIVGLLIFFLVRRRAQ